MRKFMALVLCVFLVLCLYACQDSQNQSEQNPIQDTLPYSDWKYEEGTVFRFPEGVVLCGVDLSGKLGFEAYSSLRDAIESYTLKLNINDQDVTVTAQDMRLSLDSEKMAAYIEALKNGEDPRSQTRSMLSDRAYPLLTMQMPKVLLSWLPSPVRLMIWSLLHRNWKV